MTEATEIDQEMGSVDVGVAVEVEGEEQPDGSIVPPRSRSKTRSGRPRTIAPSPSGQVRGYFHGRNG